MGIFYSSKSTSEVVMPVLTQALKEEPKSLAYLNQQATKLTKQVSEQVSGKFDWRRLVIAIAILVVIAAAGMWAATQTALADWSKGFLDFAKLFVGVIVGLLGGEAAAKR